MHAGVASLLLLGAAVAMLLVAGAGDWSVTFAGLWYAVFGTAVALALTSLVRGLVLSSAPLDRRVGAVVLAVPALVAAALFVYFVVVVVPRIAD